ncbi:chitosanase [Streptomyces sp. DHE7-1]|nr:chitosanase [Streptomyces sp. DHE7-1]
MRRTGILLLAAVPVAVTAVVHVLGPGPSGSGDAEGTRASAPQRARQDAEARAESERAGDAEVVADAPPGLAAPAKKEPARRIVASAENVDTSRVDTARRRFLHEGNLELRTPLTRRVYGETYEVR